MITNGRVLCPGSGLDRVMDIKMEAGTITELGEALDTNGCKVAEPHTAAY